MEFTHGPTGTTNFRLYGGPAKHPIALTGLEIDTGANIISVISEDQNVAYFKSFGLPKAIRPSHDRRTKGIGGNRSLKGLVNIQIPCPDLSFVIKVKFLLLSVNRTALLCMRELYQNGLDISIQKRTINGQGNSHDPSMENFFLVYRWEPDDFPFSLYIQEELRRIHRVFGHPAIRSTKYLLRRAKGRDIDEDPSRASRKKAETC